MHDSDSPHSPKEPPEQDGRLHGRELGPHPVEGLGQGTVGVAGPGWALVLWERIEEDLRIEVTFAIPLSLVDALLPEAQTA